MGYSWPGVFQGFSPRSKWTYGEVFHTAVVPRPPISVGFRVLYDFGCMLAECYMVYFVTLCFILPLLYAVLSSLLEQ